MRSTPELEKVLRKLDARLEEVAQILPTLATKADLSTLITKDDLAALATKWELMFATKADLREALDLQFQRTKVLIESLHDDVRLILENQVMLHQRIERLEAR